MPGFNPKSTKPYDLRGLSDATEHVRTTVQRDLGKLIDLGVATEADRMVIERDLDKGFVSAREVGRLRVKASRAGVPNAFDLFDV